MSLSAKSVHRSGNTAMRDSTVKDAMVRKTILKEFTWKNTRGDPGYVRLEHRTAGTAIAGSGTREDGERYVVEVKLPSENSTHGQIFLTLAEAEAKYGSALTYYKEISNLDRRITKWMDSK